jgi:hypothetical protein
MSKLDQKLDQKEMQASFTTLASACSALRSALKARGENVQAPAMSDSHDIVADFAALQAHHEDLIGRFSCLQPRQPAATIPAPSESAAPTAPAAPVAPALTIVRPPAPAATADSITAEESAKLTWTEKVLLAQGKLSSADAKSRAQARISARAASKPQAGAKKPTLTERVLAAKGVKTLAELEAKRPSRSGQD